MRSVCTSIYLLFNEGYNSTHAETLIRRDLCLEAMRLCKILRARFPTEPALAALQSLMCFHVARFESRIDEAGALVILEDQDRSIWNQGLIQQACLLLRESAQGKQLSRYHLEASIAAQHCLAASFDETNWQQIEAFYKALYALVPNPILQLNLAIIASRTQSLAAAIKQLETLRAEKSLARYGLLHATLGEFHRLEGGPQRALLEGKLRLVPL